MLQHSVHHTTPRSISETDCLHIAMRSQYGPCNVTVKQIARKLRRTLFACACSACAWLASLIACAHFLQALKLSDTTESHDQSMRVCQLADSMNSRDVPSSHFRSLGQLSTVRRFGSLCEVSHVEVALAATMASSI